MGDDAVAPFRLGSVERGIGVGERAFEVALRSMLREAERKGHREDELAAREWPFDDPAANRLGHQRGAVRVGFGQVFFVAGDFRSVCESGEMPSAVPSGIHDP